MYFRLVEPCWVPVMSGRENLNSKMPQARERWPPATGILSCWYIRLWTVYVPTWNGWFMYTSIVCSLLKAVQASSQRKIPEWYKQNLCGAHVHCMYMYIHCMYIIWNLYSIVCMGYTRHIPVIYRKMRYLRYIPGIELHDKGYLSVGFNACIPCLGCALWYTQICKARSWRWSMQKIQS